MLPDPAVLTIPRQVPLDRPFRCRDILEAGVTRHRLYGLEAQGSLRRVAHGVMVNAQLADTLELRAAVLRLVIPPGCVVTDSSAAWLHGVSIFPRRPGDSPLPDLQCFSADNSRMRREGVASGSRALSAADVMQVGDLWVTTPLRTACDLGRLLNRFDALAALDGFARIGVTASVVEQETLRFAGMRGVRMLRALGPLMNGLSESPGESALRLHWYEAALPSPVLQHWVCGDGWRRYRLDLTDPRVLYAAEYDGEDFHGEDRAPHDQDRRTWLESQGWTVDVFRRDTVYRTQDAYLALQRGHRRAVERMRGR